MALAALITGVVGIVATTRNGADSNSAQAAVINDDARNLFAPPKTVGRDYYVSPRGSDGANGTADHPWASIQHAAEKARPGDTVHVASGTYWGAITTQTSGNDQARIRFISDQRWGAAIRSTGSPYVWTNNGGYVDLVGFDISGDGTIGIINRGSHVRILENHVHNIPGPGCTSNGGAGIDNSEYTASDDDVIGNVVHDIGNPSLTCPDVHGIYHSNLRGRIWNNISYHNQGWGIHLWHAARDVQVANNLVFGNGAGGIIVGAGGDPGGVTNDGTTVTNNIVVYNRVGIQEYGSTGAHNRYLRNLVYRNQSTDMKLLTGSESGTIKEDPGFVNFKPDGSGDYHLAQSSPGLHAGDCSAAPSRDADGVLRAHDRDCGLGPLLSAGEHPAWPWQ